KKKPDFNMENVRPQKDPKEVKEGVKVDPPEASSKGWVVELRGYTYNSGKKGFVLDTLVTNLAGTEYLPAGQAPPAAASGTTETKPDNPVLGRVSHVVLYQAEVNSGNKLLGASQVGSLVTGGGSGMQGEGGSSAGMMPSGVGSGGMSGMMGG